MKHVAIASMVAVCGFVAAAASLPSKLKPPRELGGTGASLSSTAASLPAPTPTPCPNGGVPSYSVTQTTGTITAGTEDLGIHCGHCTSLIALPFPVSFYDFNFTTARISSSGNIQFVGDSRDADVDNASLPSTALDMAIMPFWDAISTSGNGEGVFISVTGAAPHRVFNVEWRGEAADDFGQTHPVHFEVQLLEGSNSFSFVYGASDGGGAATIGAQRDTGSEFTQVAGPGATMPAAGTKYIFSANCSTTATPTPTPTPKPTVAPPPPPCGAGAGYLLKHDHAGITRATHDTGNHCDDCVTPITFPFPVKFYGKSYTTANVSSNGNLQFASADNEYRNEYVPSTAIKTAIFPLWDDLRTDAPGDGIFTSTTGQAPHRVFHVEWRARQFDTEALTNFEINVFEGSQDFEIIYGYSTGSFHATFGAQQGGVEGLFSNANGLQTAPTQVVGGNPPPESTRHIYSASCPLAPPFSCGSGPASVYAFNKATGAIVPGTEDTGLHCSDFCANYVDLPFPVTIFDRTFTTIWVTGLGDVEFNTGEFYGTTITAFTANGMGTAYSSQGNPGVFTSVTGTAPNRVFNIEWRVSGIDGQTSELEAADFELQLLEGSSSFNLIYGQSNGQWRVADGDNVVQNDISVHADGNERWTDVGGPSPTPFPSGTKLKFALTCPSPTPTPTPIRTTPTPTPRPTPTPLPQPPPDDECYLDATFNGDGRLLPGPFSGFDVIHDLARQSDGKIVAVGMSDLKVRLARYLPSGALDATFGSGGIVTTDQEWGYQPFSDSAPEVDVNQDPRIVLRVQGDNKIVVAGTLRAGTSSIFLMRFKADGTTDTSFGTNGIVVTDLKTYAGSDAFFFSDDLLRDIALGPEGKIIVTGPITLRYSGDGSVDTSFGNEGFAAAAGSALAVLDDGSIILASAADTYHSGWLVEKLTSNGKPELTFGSEGVTHTSFDDPNNEYAAVPRHIMVQRDGKIVVAGYTLIGSPRVKNCALARYNGDGRIDAQFGAGGAVTVDAGGNSKLNRIALRQDGTVVGVGTKNIATGVEDFIVVHFNLNGAIDKSFGSGGIASKDFFGLRDFGNGLALEPDGGIIAGGLATSPGTGRDFGLTRFSANGQIDTSFGRKGIVTTAGLFTGSTRYAVATQADGKTVIGGIVGEAFLIARYNVDGSLDTTFGAKGVATTTFDEVNTYRGNSDGLPAPEALFTVSVLADGHIVAGGGAGIGYGYGTDRYFLFARYNSNGKPDATFGGGDGRVGYVFWSSGSFTSSDEGATDVIVLPDGRIVAVGDLRDDPPSGGFSSAVVQRFKADGSRDSSFSGQLPSINFAHLAALPDGRIVVGGASAVSGQEDKFYLALLSASDGKLDTSFGGTGSVTTDFGASDQLRALVVQPDSKIIAVGSTGFGASSDIVMARYRTNGSLDTGFGSAGKVATNFGAAEVPEAATLLSDGRIVVGGLIYGSDFTKSNFLLARYTSKGGLDVSFGDRGLLVSVICAADNVIQQSINDLAVSTDDRVVAAGRPGIARYLKATSSTCVLGCPSSSPTPTPTPRPTATPKPTPTPARAIPKLLNISTRMEVLTGSNVLIGGFIVTGTEQKKVLLRAIGPSLPVNGKLADPVLELHDGNGIIATNDNWKINDTTGQSQQAAVSATGAPPNSDLESALIVTLPANNSAYTAIVRGQNGGSGVGQVEVYDLGTAANSQLANISTRGFVDIGDNVMIGGVIVGPNSAGSTTVLLRAIGPSLGVSGALVDPTLELHNGNGTTIATNDNWKIDDKTGASQQAEIEATKAPPQSDFESALIHTVTPGNYTAIVRGNNGTTGIGLVEAYNLQ
jgi:uncharacterized delta-60 repeat protein